jgi:hypothetical protein
MTNQNIFEKAVRLKLRFAHKGFCSVEDLWDLSVEELDEIYKRLNASLKVLTEESLLEVPDNKNDVLQLKVDIIKHIVKTKLCEKEKAEKKVLLAERKQKLLKIIADKQDESLRELSLEELNELLGKL